MPLLRRRLHPQRLGGQSVTFTRSQDTPRVIWRFSDGKPGHDNQSLGLVDALRRRVPVEPYEVPVLAGQGPWFDWLAGRFPAGRLLPPPWLLLGAGHATQLPLLAARRASGGRAVVLMSPVLPCQLFDLCLIPAHDRPRRAANILETRGSLNRVQPVVQDHRQHALLLIGGPSRHYQWDSGEVLEQISRIIRYTPMQQWTLATSRRTPADFAEHLWRGVSSATRSLRMIPWQETSPDWLQRQYQAVDCAWVTQDSVSMLYEALTAGLPTGVLELPARRDSRLTREVCQLIRDRQVTPFSEWTQGRTLRRPASTFDEANRCADWICTHWT